MFVFVFSQVASEVFSAAKSKFIDGSTADGALLAEFEVLRGRLRDRFKYAKLFKDEAELQREQEEKRKQKQQFEQQQQQNQSQGGGGADEATADDDVASKLDKITIAAGKAVKS